MAFRNILHKKRAEAFKEWLRADGWTIEAPVGQYEVIRARKGKRLALFFEGHSKEHLSYADNLNGIVHMFINNKKPGHAPKRN